MQQAICRSVRQLNGVHKPLGEVGDQTQFVSFSSVGLSMHPQMPIYKFCYFLPCLLSSAKSFFLSNL